VEKDKVCHKYWNAGMGIGSSTFEIIDADVSKHSKFRNREYALTKNRAILSRKTNLKSNSKNICTYFRLLCKGQISCVYMEVNN
jgi:hypothetical protein